MSSKRKPKVAPVPATSVNTPKKVLNARTSSRTPGVQVHGANQRRLQPSVRVKGATSSKSTGRSENQLVLPAPLVVNRAAGLIGSRYLEEPKLAFCGGHDVTPKSGITTYGPYTLGQPKRHPRTARIGVIGTAETIHAARNWIIDRAQGVDGEGVCASFPGCSRDAGFFVDLVFDEAFNAKLTQHELGVVLGTADPKSRFEAAVKLLEEKFAWFASLDRPPEYVVLALPDELVKKCGVVDYQEGKAHFHRNLRLALKAAAMRHRLTTQILLSKTIRGGRDVDLPAEVAWNFFTTLYFKLGAVPWSPIGLDPDTCYIGVSFYRPLGSNSHMQASLAQVFNSTGDALVIRGEEFPWSPSRQEKSPHLDAEQARRLVDAVLKRYGAETQGKAPRRVVIHKKSRFWSDETRGFREAMVGVKEFDLVSVSPTSSTRLLRQGTYPVLRGTRFTVGDIDYLYTNGYVPALGTFPHGHVPSPLQLADHRGGDTSVDELVREILILTKLNWNSADFSSLLPITLGSSMEVADVLREVPESQVPLANYKYYI